MTAVIPKCLATLHSELDAKSNTLINYGPFNIEVSRTFHFPSCDMGTYVIETLTAICCNLNDGRNQQVNNINLQTALDSVVNDSTRRVSECGVCDRREKVVVTWSHGAHKRKMLLIQIN